MLAAGVGLGLGGPVVAGVVVVVVFVVVVTSGRTNYEPEHSPLCSLQLCGHFFRQCPSCAPVENAWGDRTVKKSQA